MTKEELLAEIERHGGKVEPIKRVCQFQTFGKNIFDFCIQPKDSPYWICLGSAGGWGVRCWGQSPLQLPEELRQEGIQLPESELKGLEPCPFRGDDTILGWRIMLPAGD